MRAGFLVADKKIEESFGNLALEVEKRFSLADKKIEESVENLALVVKASFDAVDKRFDAVDKRFDAVDKRFDGIDNRLDNIETEVHEIGRGVTVLSGKVDESRSDLTMEGGRVDDHELRIHKLEQVI